MNPLLLSWITKNFVKALPYLLIVGILWYGIHTLQVYEFNKGAASVQQKWDAEKTKHREEVLVLKGKLLAQEMNHRDETQRISHVLVEAQKQYTSALNQLSTDYKRRLLLSAQRSGVYHHQAEGGTVECGSLADHAGKLDTTLEEGRSLVGELRTTLELRDTQIKSLGNQIKSDRKLLE